MKRQSDHPPARSLDQLTSIADAVVAVCGGIVIGVLCGVALAELLRFRGRNWTFAMLTLPLAACAAVVAIPLAPGDAGLAGIAFAVGISCGSLGWGAYRRLDDRRSGGDREAAARRRRRLLDRPRRRLAERANPATTKITAEIPLGRCARDRLRWVRRGTPASGSHVLIPGATGAGKTTSLAALLTEYVARSGFGAVVLEAKVDEALHAAAVAAAAARGKQVRLVSPDGPGFYDPLSQGSVDERSERLIAVEAWGSEDADFYRQAASPFLRLVIRALDASGARATLRRVAATCDPDELENVAAQLSDDTLSEEVVAATATLRGDERRAVAGLRARLQNLADSEFARRWLDPDVASDPVIDLRDSVRAGEILYFRFDTDRTGNVGKGIAQMVLLDLGAAASSMMGSGVGTFVAVDEFGALESSALDRLYARGRAAGMSVAVGTQTIADLREAGPAVRERVGATIESLICHRIGNQEDAEWLAQLIGTVAAWQSTIRTDALGLPTDKGTRTRGYRFEVHPTELQRLGCGEAYVARLDQTANSRADRMRVVPPWERLAV